jgi:hypothetical protein
MNVAGGTVRQASVLFCSLSFGHHKGASADVNGDRSARCARSPETGSKRLHQGAQDSERIRRRHAVACGRAKDRAVPSTVHRIWRTFSPQPHRTETFKPSTDPRSWRKCATCHASSRTRRTRRWSDGQTLVRLRQLHGPFGFDNCAAWMKKISRFLDLASAWHSWASCFGSNTGRAKFESPL